MKNLGKRIRLARELANMNQEDLAVHLGVTKQSVSAYETGQVDPKASIVDKIAEVTGVPVSFLFEKNDDVGLPAANDPRENYGSRLPVDCPELRREINFLNEVKQYLTEQIAIQAKLISAYENGFVPSGVPKKSV